MNKHILVGWMVLIALTILTPNPSSAQSSTGNDAYFTLRVEGLTSQERDAVNSDLQSRSDLKLVFACVPAGIMVFAGEMNSTRTSTRQNTLALMQARMTTTRMSEEPLGIAEAEAVCAQQRNR